MRIFLTIAAILAVCGQVSGQDQVVISAQDNQGARFTAPESRTYRFTLVDGAYSFYAQDNPAFSGWKNRVFAYKNRGIEWTHGEPVEDWGLNPGNFDFSLGTAALSTTPDGALWTSQGMYADIPLQKDDYLIWVIDDRENCFADNPGSVTLSVGSPHAVPVGLFDDHCAIHSGTIGNVRYNSDLNRFGVWAEVSGSRGEYGAVREVYGDFRFRARVDLDSVSSSLSAAGVGISVLDEIEEVVRFSAYVWASNKGLLATWKESVSSPVQNSDVSVNPSAHNGEMEIERIGQTVRMYYIHRDTGVRTLFEQRTIQLIDPVYPMIWAGTMAPGIAGGLIYDVELIPITSHCMSWELY